MSTTVASTNQRQLSGTKAQPKFSVFMSGESIKSLVSRAVGKDPQRFSASIISAVSTNPTLQGCTNISILSAALLGESLGLSPSPQLGQYYLIPFAKKDKQGNVLETNAQFVLGAKGYKQLAMRSGQYLDIDVIEIKEGEYKGRDKFTGKQKFEFIENDDERYELPTVGYMAYFELLNGFKKQVYWTKAKMLRHAAKYSPAFNVEAVKGKEPKYDRVSYEDYLAGKYPKSDEWKYSSFWYKNFDEMAFKTLIRHLISQWGVMSIEMQDAFVRDNAVIKEGGEPEYVEVDESAFNETTPTETGKTEGEQPTVEEQAEFDFFAGTEGGENG